MKTVPKPGEFYRHFKNRMYQVLAVAIHSETGEKMVVYQALYGDYSVWVRPLPMFMEELDHKKYPDAEQKNRFERVILRPEHKSYDKGDGGWQQEMEEFDIFILDMDAETEVGKSDSSARSGSYEDTAANPMLLEFLDTESIEERVSLLQKMKGRVSQREVDSLCLCLDAKPSTGTIEEQLEDLIRYLKMQQRYDASRLRRR